MSTKGKLVTYNILDLSILESAIKARSPLYSDLVD